MPDGRSGKYSIWRACERLGIRPPGIKAEWLDMEAPKHAEILASDEIRCEEEMKILSAQVGATTV